MALRAVSTAVRSGRLTGDASDYYFTQPLPAAELPSFDPFLLLHHHGPMTLPPDTRGMPFGPHPHRGFCTLTVILAGSVVHQDSHGYKSQIDGSAEAAGAQWMTAGRGLIHNESTPKEFNEAGGPLELLQLWINLPARLKLTPAHYEGLPPAQVAPQPLPDGSGATIQLFTGAWPGLPTAYVPVVDTVSALLRVPAGAVLTLPAAAAQAVFVYVLRGKPTVGDHAAKPRVLVAFDATDDAAATEIALAAGPDEDALLFYVAGTPLHEPVVQHGPFVMNTEREIMEAMRDYQMGKMGVFIDE